MSEYDEEDQRNEIEALESIYPDELTVISEEPHCFRILVSSQSLLENGETASCTLQFIYPPQYPERAPLMEIIEQTNLDEETETCELKRLMSDEAAVNLGTVMVFSIVAVVQEKLNCLVEENVRLATEAREDAEREKQEAERKRLEGTLVTIESFLAWKSAFDAEMEERRRLQGEKVVKTEERLSGKELFMRDHTLDDSDLKFLEREGDSVQVDESLFQDLDDLDLDDDFEIDAIS